MADQNQRISDLLDTLTDADSTEIETALRIFEPNDVAAVIAERALAGGGGGGGSVPGVAIVHGPYAFAFNSPGILTAAGFPLGFTPTVGDLLLDAFIKITTAWDGTTPSGDLGPGLASAGSGLWKLIGGASPINLSHADDDMSSPPIGLVAAYNKGACLSLSAQCVTASLVTPADPLSVGSFVPMFVTADITEFAVCVSEDGTPGGTDPGATQGAGEFYAITTTPTLT